MHTPGVACILARMNLGKLHAIIDTMSLDEARDYCAVLVGVLSEAVDADTWQVALDTAAALAVTP